MSQFYDGPRRYNILFSPVVRMLYCVYILLALLFLHRPPIFISNIYIYIVNKNKKTRSYNNNAQETLKFLV